VRLAARSFLSTGLLFPQFLLLVFAQPLINIIRWRGLFTEPGTNAIL